MPFVTLDVHPGIPRPGHPVDPVAAARRAGLSEHLIASLARSENRTPLGLLRHASRSASTSTQSNGITNDTNRTWRPAFAATTRVPVSLPRRGLSGRRIAALEFQHSPLVRPRFRLVIDNVEQSSEGRNQNRVTGRSTTASVTRNDLLIHHGRASRSRRQRTMSCRCQSLTLLPLRSTTGLGKSE